MKDLGNTLKSGFNKSKSVVKDAFDFTSEKITDGLKALGNLGTDAQTKFQDYMRRLMADLPLLERAGYQTIQFEAGISLPPSVEIHFKKIKEIDEKELAEIREEFKDRKIFLLMLGALIKANAFQKAISSENFNSDIITIDITVPPEVKVKFKRKEPALLEQNHF